MKIGLTGASGLLGSRIATLLNNYEITAFSRSKHPLLNSIPFISLDITNELDVHEKLNGFDLVIHCAGFVSFKKKDSNTLYNTNINGTANVVNACLSNGIKKLIHISSTAILDSFTNPLQISAKTLWDNQSPKGTYAKSKYFAELEVWRGAEEGLNVATICPGVIVGLGNSNKSSDQLYSVIKNNWNVYPTGTNGFIYVDDVVKIIDIIIKNQLFGSRYLAVTHNLSYKQVLTTLANNLNKKAPKIALSGFLFYCLKALSWFFEKVHLPFPLPYQGLKNTHQKLQYQISETYSIQTFTDSNFFKTSQ